MPKLSPPVSAIPMGCCSLLRVSIPLRLVRAHLTKLPLLVRAHLAKLPLLARLPIIITLRWLVVAILLPISPSPLLAALLCLLVLRMRRKR